MMNLRDSISRFGVVLALTASGPIAVRADSSAFGYDLGLIIGAAEKCSYRLDEDVVSAMVEAQVPASDLDFAALFQMQIGYHRRETDELSGLELRLRCETAQRSASALGILAK